MQYGAAQSAIQSQHAAASTSLLPRMKSRTIIAPRSSTKFGKLDALTAEAERAIDLLQERRTALISAAVTGKIDVRGLVRNAEAA